MNYQTKTDNSSEFYLESQILTKLNSSLVNPVYTECSPSKYSPFKSIKRSINVKPP